MSFNGRKRDQTSSIGKEFYIPFLHFQDYPTQLNTCHTFKSIIEKVEKQENMKVSSSEDRLQTDRLLCHNQYDFIMKMWVSDRNIEKEVWKDQESVLKKIKRAHENKRLSDLEKETRIISIGKPVLDQIQFQKDLWVIDRVTNVPLNSLQKQQQKVEHNGQNNPIKKARKSKRTPNFLEKEPVYNIGELQALNKLGIGTTEDFTASHNVDTREFGNLNQEKDFIFDKTGVSQRADGLFDDEINEKGSGIDISIQADFSLRSMTDKCTQID